MTSNHPPVEDGYSDVLRAIRLMEGGSRAEFDQGSDLLTSLGQEANPILVLMCRQLLNAVSVLSDRDRTDVLDHMATTNIAQAEGMGDDEQG
jgi:hypothetical protein